MKRLITSILLVLLLTGVAFAGPMVVCDPQLNVTHYIVALDGAAPVNTIYAEQDGYAIVLDLTAVQNGSHSLTVKAANAVGESEEVPFAFDVVHIPSAPTGLRIE